MRYTFFRTMGIAAVSAAMIMGTAMPAFAVDDNPPAAAADTLTVSKVLEKDASDYVPNEKWERCTPDAERLCQLYRWGVDNARYGIELFYDLIFVHCISVLTSTMHHV